MKNKIKKFNQGLAEPITKTELMILLPIIIIGSIVLALAKVGVL